MKSSQVRPTTLEGGGGAQFGDLPGSPGQHGDLQGSGHLGHLHGPNDLALPGQPSSADELGGGGGAQVGDLPGGPGQHGDLQGSGHLGQLQGTSVEHRAGRLGGPRQHADLQGSLGEAPDILNLHRKYKDYWRTVKCPKCPCEGN